MFQNSDHEMWFKVTIRDYMNSPAGLVKPILPLMTYQYEYQELDSHPIWTTDIVFRAMMNYLDGEVESDRTAEEYQQLVDKREQQLKRYTALST